MAAEPHLLGLDDGRVAALTPLAARAVPPREETLGDPDALLLPALSDAHIHLLACAADRAGLDLSSDAPRTSAALLARLAAAADTLAPGAWLRASGYDESWLDGTAQPTRADLDRAVPRHPLRMRHATRHATVLNSPALARLEQALGRLDDSRAPRARDGTALGVVYGLEPEITRIVGPLDAAALDASLGRVGGDLARHGVVHLDEVTASNDAARVRRLAGAVADGALPQRLRVYVGDPDEIAPARRAASVSTAVRVAGVKLLARSTDEVHAAAFTDTLRRARRCGVPVAVHAVDADVIDAVLAALAAAPPRSGDDRTPDRLEHCSICPPELVRRIAAAGVAVVTQPAFLACRGDKYRREVEPPLWDWLYPIRALRRAGVLVAAGSDAPVVPVDPRLGLDGATRRTSTRGTVLGAAETLDDAAALDLFSGAPARLRGEPGSSLLTRGARADLLVVEPDSWHARWRSLRVRHTLSAGELLA